MKKVIFGLLILAAAVLPGCEDDDHDQILVPVDNTAPPVPQGVYSVTGDGEVLLYWLPIDDVDGDFETYVVYRSDFDPDTGYWFIGETTQEYFVDDSVVNGHTYYYAVSSIDHDGNLSALSYEYVFDTPRPQGANAVMFDYNAVPSYAGWDFSAMQTVNYLSVNCDIYAEYLSGDDVFYINVTNEDVDIQDMGYTVSLDDIGYSPDAGWSQNGWLEVILGHTYVIWTADNHYAKIRVTAIVDDHIIFDWAYQVDPGNPELKPLIKRLPGYLRHPERTA
ncbi:MAG: hypothetical protein GYA46_14715 [candidate division Zixibacteria bacterium]|nr:hypothetical protein [candidate division Zixibacteria bacterium]